MTKLDRVLKKFSEKYKTVLVTGGAGAIGSNIVKNLIDSKIEKIIVLDNLSSGYLENIPKSKKVFFIEGDIVDGKTVNEVFEKWKNIDVVFHLAAHFANQNSIEHPVADLKTNILGTLNLLDAANKRKIKSFVYFSTSCIYKVSKKGAKESDLNLQFDTPYAISKYSGERYVNFYNSFYGLPTVILRVFNSFGPGEKPGLYRNVIPNFFQKAFLGESLIVTGTGEETRNFTYVDDIVRGSLLASLSSKAIGHTLNLGSNRAISVNKLATTVNQMTGNKKKIIYKSRRKWDHSISRSADLTLTKKLIGFDAEISFEVGLEKTYESFKDFFNT